MTTPADVLSMMQSLREAGESYRAIARKLNEKGLPTEDGLTWTQGEVRNVLKRSAARTEPLGDPSQFTLHQALLHIYLPESPGLAKQTADLIRYRINSWRREVGDLPIAEITREHFVKFRTGALSRGLATRTIETAVDSVRAILRMAAEVGVLDTIPATGRPLKHRFRLRPTPTVEEFAAIYANVNVAWWPRGRGAKRPSPIAPSWWRAVLAAVYCTALRKSDLLTLTWDEIEPTRIVRRQDKTGNDIVLPLHPVLRDHLAELPRTNAPFVFGHVGARMQISNELTGMAKVANVPPFLMHSFRRLAGQMWEKARAGSGRLILGHQIVGSARSYLDPFKMLEQAARDLYVPPIMKLRIAAPMCLAPRTSVPNGAFSTEKPTTIAELAADDGGRVLNSKTVVSRINRKLEKAARKLKSSRGWRPRQLLGAWHIVDLQNNIVETKVDLEALARKLRVLRENETIAKDEEDDAT